nr:MAG TPA: hypothetical protein [Caudoviricetes sp.]
MYNNVTNKYKTFIKYKQNIYKNFNKKCSQFLGTFFLFLHIIKYKEVINWSY